VLATFSMHEIWLNLVGNHITIRLPKRRLFFCKGNLMISTKSCNTCKGKPKFNLKNKLNKLFTHLARENQRENSKVFPAEGATIYSQPCDKVKGTGPHWEVNPLK
jgi:hypothetical protein